MLIPILGLIDAGGWTNLKLRIAQNASAEFGNFQGGVVNLVIKSGANQYHGNLFESFRHDKLNNRIFPDCESATTLCADD